MTRGISTMGTSRDRPEPAGVGGGESSDSGVSRLFCFPFEGGGVCGISDAAMDGTGEPRWLSGGKSG